jgi:hypothetical protein
VPKPPEEQGDDTGQVSSSKAEAAPSSGFEGHLRGASLADLIQLECMSGVRAAVSVHSLGRQAYLFFEGGRITHALCGDLQDEAAVLEILGWDTGTFGSNDRVWPARPAMTTPWQQLVMTAAQRRDEQEREQVRSGAQALRRSSSPDAGSAAPRVVALPSRVPVSSKPPPRSVPPEALASTESGARAEAGAINPQSATGSRVARVRGAEPARAPARGLLATARIGAMGQLYDAQGEVNGRLEVFAYVRRLAELIGDDFGLTSFRSIECQLNDRKLLIFADTAESFVAIEATSDADMGALCRALGY